MSKNIKELSNGFFYYFKDEPFIKLESEALRLSDESFDTFLNHLKIPKKFMYRYADECTEQAAETVNFWLNRAENIGGVVDGENIVKVFDSRKLFVPVDFIETSLKSYFNADNTYGYYDGDIYIFTVATGEPDIELCNGDIGFVSIRVMFSDCFEITPRVDAVLTIRGGYENYYYPIQGRKFRVVDSSPAQVDALVREFSDIVSKQLIKNFIPRLNEMIEMDAHLPSNAFIGRLCSELRLSKRIGQFLLSEVGDTEMALHTLVKKVCNAVMPEIRPDFIDLNTSREIEIALSRAIEKGAFR